MIWIGIDPGVNTGFAAWDAAAGRLVEVDTLPIHRALQRIDEYILHYGRGLRVVFEDARLRKWIPKEGSVSQWKGRAMGAGSVMRDCSIWEDFLTDRRVQFEHPAPRRGLTKMDADTFRLYTGWTGRTSNHGRDAAMLVVGK